MKSEPHVYSYDDLVADGRTHWDGVRNYQARNMMRDQMKKGDLAFFYHSNCEVPGIVAIVTIAREGYPDFTAWDPKSKYYDPKSTPQEPRWYMVDVAFVAKAAEPVTRDDLKAEPKLEDMVLLQKGSRLSIQPVTAAEWRHVLKMAGLKESW